jgi:CheY-specific phosphatase CheX
VIWPASRLLAALWTTIAPEQGNGMMGGSGGPTMAKLVKQALSQCPKTKVLLKPSQNVLKEGMGSHTAASAGYVTPCTVTLSPVREQGNGMMGGSGGPTMAKLVKQALSQCPKTKVLLGGSDGVTHVTELLNLITGKLTDTLGLEWVTEKDSSSLLASARRLRSCWADTPRVRWSSTMLPTASMLARSVSKVRHDISSVQADGVTHVTELLNLITGKLTDTVHNAANSLDAGQITAAVLFGDPLKAQGVGKLASDTLTLSLASLPTPWALSGSPKRTAAVIWPASRLLAH